MKARPGGAGGGSLPETIMADEDNHIDHLETLLELMTSLGEQLYCVRRLPAGNSCTV